MRRSAIAFVALAAIAVSPGVLAQQKKKPTPPEKPAPSAAPAPAPAPSSSASALKGSAIVRVAAQVAADLGEVPPGALVAVSPLAADVPAPKAEELAQRLATQIAGRLGSAQPHPQPVALAVARGVSGRAASLVYVQLELVKGELRATADLYPVVSNGWERLRNPVPGPRAHAFASAAIDAEVRTFLQPIVLEQAAVHKARHEETDVLAVGCGDLDADGGLEIVTASRSRVAIGKLRAGKLEVVSSAPWKELAYAAPIPLREPLGALTVARNEILVGISDRYAIGLDATLTPRKTLSGPPIPGADACVLLSPESGGFEGNGVSCPLPAKGARPAEVLPLPLARYDAIAALDLGGSLVLAAREPGGRLKLRRTEGSGKVVEQAIEQTGAQLVLADLDLDGVPEIAFSGDFAESDALMVWSWRGAALQQRMRVTTKEPIRALAACPPEEKGLPGLVAIVGPEVWLVR